MALGSITLGVRAGPGLGPPDPLPAALTAALRRVRVTQRDATPSTFDLTFGTDTGATVGAGFAPTTDPRLQPFARVVLRTLIDGTTSTLMDGFVTGRTFAPANGPGDTTFTVTGEDFGVLLDRVDYSREFPSLPDGLIAGAVLLPWLATGLVADIAPDPRAMAPYDHVPQQASTDRALLYELAAQNGFVFHVRPSQTVPFANTAYWGPPPRAGAPVALLDVVAGPASTVESVSFVHDANADTLYAGFVPFDPEVSDLPVPVLTTGYGRTPAFAEQAADWSLRQTRVQLWREQQLDPVRANLTAQARTDSAGDAVVTATCDVDTVRLGRVLCAPAVVGVRGAGATFDGLYYLKEAVHDMAIGADASWNHTQTLTLTREGVGSTVTGF